MGSDVYPCIIYQRLRPSSPEASALANETVWPLADELVAHRGYTVCGLYGDSEYAPPFCGGSEIRPGFNHALRHAREIAANVGTCTLIIGDASAIGDGDPFLPAYVPWDINGQVDIQLVNFHLRSHAIATSLRSAWRYFDLNRKTETQPRLIDAPLIAGPKKEIEVFVRRDPERLLASLYLANPMQTPMTLKWTQLLRRQDQDPLELKGGDWRDLVIPGGCGAHLETVFQGELPWVRQLRLKHKKGRHKGVSSVHLLPSDMARDRHPLIWEDRG